MNPTQQIVDPMLYTYGQLPESSRKEIDYAYEMKDYMRQVLDEIKRSDIKQLEDCNLAVQRNRTDMLKIETKQESLRKSAENLRAESRELCHDTRQYGLWGIQQIQRGPITTIQNETLPIPLYRTTLQKLEKRFITQREEVKQLEDQLRSVSGYSTPPATSYNAMIPSANSGQSLQGSSGIYGHRSHKMQPQQIASLIRHQNEAFLRIAGMVAESHERVLAVKEIFNASITPVISTGSSREDPFLAADRAELADKRLRERQALTNAALSLPRSSTAVSSTSSQNPLANSSQGISSTLQSTVGLNSNTGGTATGGTGLGAQGFGFGGTGSQSTSSPFQLGATSQSAGSAGTSFSLSSSTGTPSGSLGGFGQGFGTSTGTGTGTSFGGFGGTGSATQPVSFSSFGAGQSTFGGAQGQTQPTSAAGDLVTPSMTQKTSLSTDRNHNKKKTSSRGLGSGKH